MKQTKMEKQFAKLANEQYKVGLKHIKKGELVLALVYFDKALSLLSHFQSLKPDYDEVLSDKAALSAKIKEQGLLPEKPMSIKDVEKFWKLDSNNSKPEIQYTIPSYNLNCPVLPHHKRLFTFKCKATTQSSKYFKFHAVVLRLALYVLH